MSAFMRDGTIFLARHSARLSRCSPLSGLASRTLLKLRAPILAFGMSGARNEKAIANRTRDVPKLLTEGQTRKGWPSPLYDDGAVSDRKGRCPHRPEAERAKPMPSFPTKPKPVSESGQADEPPLPKSGPLPQSGEHEGARRASTGRVWRAGFGFRSFPSLLLLSPGACERLASGKT